MAPEAKNSLATVLIKLPNNVRNTTKFFTFQFTNKKRKTPAVKMKYLDKINKPKIKLIDDSWHDFICKQFGFNLKHVC